MSLGPETQLFEIELEPPESVEVYQGPLSAGEALEKLRAANRYIGHLIVDEDVDLRSEKFSSAIRDADNWLNTYHQQRLALTSSN